MTITAPFDCFRPYVYSSTATLQPPGCHLCGLPLKAGHAHLVDRFESTLVCTCAACGVLFSASAADRSRFRAVPRSARFRARMQRRDPGWQALGIPVRLAFLFHRSAARRWIAVIPSASGPAWVALPQPACDAFLRAHPRVRQLVGDVEALLVRREQSRLLECFGCPIDRCYALVALMHEARRGGESRPDVHAGIESLLAQLRAEVELTGAL